MALAGLTACGSNSRSTTSVGAGTATQGAPLVVGSIASTKGACITPSTTSVPDTTGAWAAYVNNHGGVAGHPIKLIQFDDSCDPGQSVTDAQVLINDHAVAIFDNTQEAPGWIPQVTAAKIPIICGIESAGSVGCFSNPNLFPSGTTVLTGLYGSVAAAKTAGAKSFSVVYCTEVASCKQALPLFKADAGLVGLDYGESLAVSNSAPDYTAQCESLAGTHSDAVFVAGPPADKFASDCTQQGYHPIIALGTSTWQTRYASVSALNGASGPFGDVPWFENVPATMSLRAAAAKILKSAAVPYYVSGAWAAGLLFQYAAAHVTQTPTTQEIYAGLYAISGTTLGGYSPPLIFTPGKPASVNCFFEISIRHGAFTAPQGTRTTCKT
jgi:branched-chain amino acid transport system substrate-binding protein